MASKSSDMVLSAFLFLLILTGLGCGISTLIEALPEQTTGPTPTPIVLRRSLSSDNQDRLLWRKNQIYMLHNTLPSPGLLVNEGQIAFINFLGGPISQVDQLTVLDSITGAVLWQSERFGDFEDVAIKKGNALVLLRRGTALNVYEINGDSKPVSTFNYFSEDVRSYITAIPESDFIYIYYYAQRGELITHTIDFTGAKIDPQRKLQTSTTIFRPFIISDTFAFLTGEEYVGIDLNTGKTLWRTLSGGRIDSWPVLLDNNLIIAPGDGRRHILLSLHIENGRELWRTEKEFSPATALCGNELFALRNDATLVRLDPTTGLGEDEIAFSPASINAGAAAYWLACNEQTVFVYFGDSQELFALNLR